MTAAAGEMPDKDPSMDDILASIRRIMLDEQARLQDSAGGPAHPATRPPGAVTDQVLILDSSMVVDDMAPKRPAPAPAAEEIVVLGSSSNAQRPPAMVDEETIFDAGDMAGTEHVQAEIPKAGKAVPLAREPEASGRTTVLGATGPIPASLHPAARQVVISPQAIEALMAPAAAAAAAASVEALLKQLSEDRLTALQTAKPPSPSIEDIVREELRPFLKGWLDEHLPAMVERLVRVEITRLIGRSGL